MNILVFNCGSSSLKYRLLDALTEAELLGGEAQRIGPPTTEPSRIVHRQQGNETVRVTPMRDHAQAFDEVMRLLRELATVRVDAIAHRMVHGGQLYRQPVLVDDPFLEKLDELRDLAPLHNPPTLELIRACSTEVPGTAAAGSLRHGLSHVDSRLRVHLPAAPRAARNSWASQVWLSRDQSRVRRHRSSSFLGR